MQNEAGREALRKYFRTYAALAQRLEKGLILESATWRANPDWGAKLGYTPAALAAANRQAIELLHEIRDQFETEKTPIVISGCLGPRGDGYVPADTMTAEEAQAYHRAQVEAFTPGRRRPRDRDHDELTSTKRSGSRRPRGRLRCRW